MTAQLRLPFFEVDLIDAEQEAAEMKELAEELYVVDQAEALQAKILFKSHDEVKPPGGPWDLGSVGGKKTRP